ncbi:MAG: hypothetical protein AABO57_01210 [Acidobacteriota bacterium]
MTAGKHKVKFVVLLCLLTITTSSSAQIRNDKRLSVIQPELRERFVGKLNLYFELKRTHHYEKLYELLSQRYSGVTREKLSREEFKRKNQEVAAQGRNAIPIKWKLAKIMKALDDKGNETYFIFVDMKARYRGRDIDDKAYFEARMENGDWYFREYYVET